MRCVEERTAYLRRRRGRGEGEGPEEVVGGGLPRREETRDGEALSWGRTTPAAATAPDRASMAALE